MKKWNADDLYEMIIFGSKHWDKRYAFVRWKNFTVKKVSINCQHLSSSSFSLSSSLSRKEGASSHWSLRRSHGSFSSEAFLIFQSVSQNVCVVSKMSAFSNCTSQWASSLNDSIACVRCRAMEGRGDKLLRGKETESTIADDYSARRSNRVRGTWQNSRWTKHFHQIIAVK